MNLTSDLVYRNWCISPIFFEIGIPNLVCKCILGCLSVTNHYWVTVTLTSDLVFKNYCVQSISPILFDVGIRNLGWWFLLGWRSGAYHFESLWPWHWLLASFLGFSCYIAANFPQMCLMLDQFLWGHLSRVCDISCFHNIFPNFWKKRRYDISWESSASRRFSWNIMPYLLFLKKQLNFKMSSAANYRWHFMGKFLACLENFHVCWFFFKLLFRNTISVKQFGSRSGPTFCHVRSGSKMFAIWLSADAYSR